jgi:hypothetical protein
MTAAMMRVAAGLLSGTDDRESAAICTLVSRRRRRGDRRDLMA